MNKGVVIGVGVVIVIAAIAGAFAFFGNLDTATGPSAGIGIGEEVEVTPSPGEAQQEAPIGEEAEFSIKDVAEIVVEPPEEESPSPPDINITVRESVGFAGTP